MIILVAIAFLVGLKDARNREIPNTLSGALALFGLLLQLIRLLLQTHFLPVDVMGFLTTSIPLVRLVRMLPPPSECIIFAFVTLGILTALELSIRSSKNVTGLGFGDIKYLAAWATILGHWVLFVMCAGCLLGMLWALKRRQSTFALGPWLSGAALFLCCIFVAL
ncbi:MAG TPA: prepilin peptidase [Candidatus Coprovicinus avistercoris]|uniref:Prepilin peptidase n=1 Tax=Candidatus Coprovicinus avistercoris TaxID=2840754 RepID=A0A9D1L3E2_9ACTN|nr:prepilin peptidase [Candidatus Coprovicinus avistercoris]